MTSRAKERVETVAISGDEMLRRLQSPTDAIHDLEAKVEEFKTQAREQHVSSCRLLGLVKDRIPEITPWDLFAAAALISEGPNANPLADLTVVVRSARRADGMMIERQRRLEEGDEK